MVGQYYPKVLGPIKNLPSVDSKIGDKCLTIIDLKLKNKLGR